MIHTRKVFYKVTAYHKHARIGIWEYDYTFSSVEPKNEIIGSEKYVSKKLRKPMDQQYIPIYL